MNILDKIVAAARPRLEAQKKAHPLSQILSGIEKQPSFRQFPFTRALKKENVSFICEVKKASPSKGVIAEDFPYVDIGKDYQKAGADALSVLTEPQFFLGADSYLKEISEQVSIPILRKDFIIDEYQIYQAKGMGANAVLLICAILTEDALRKFQNTANSLGLSCLVETHDEEEVKMALATGAHIIGVNNRNLKTFKTDIATTERLRNLVPQDKVFVSESGIHTAADVQRLRNIGIDAVLIGETLMRSSNKKEALQELRGENI